MTVSPDLRVGGRYTLVEPVAAGGMGEVWRAHDDLLDRTVAVKVMESSFKEEPEMLTRFRAEARHAAALSHPGIASVYDYGESGELAYLVMELVDGEPLSALLRRDGALPPARALGIVGQSALALQAAHDAGVVHRDVKPANILIRPDGMVKLTDFGIARALGGAAVTRTGAVIGTAHYISPEQASGQPATPASDVYSLGVVAYECLTGRRPFEAETPIGLAMSHVNEPPPPLPAELPAPVRELVGRALAKDPVDRWPTAAEMGRRALGLSRRYPRLPAVAGPPVATQTAVLGGSPPTRELPPGLRPGPRGAPSRRRVRGAFLLLGAAVVIGGFFALRALAGAAQVRVPDVVGESRTAATAALRGAGLATRWSTAPSGRVAAGRVSAQRPAPGWVLGQGSTVTLTVSTGAARVRVDATAYTGRPYPTVAGQLTASGLRVREAIRQVSGVSPDTVLSVAPTGSVPVGTTVTVTVSAAVPPAPEPPAQGPAPPPHQHHKGSHHGD